MRNWITIGLWLAIAVGVWLHAAADFRRPQLNPYEVTLLSSDLSRLTDRLSAVERKLSAVDSATATVAAFASMSAAPSAKVKAVDGPSWHDIARDSQLDELTREVSALKTDVSGLKLHEHDEHLNRLQR